MSEPLCDNTDLPVDMCAHCRGQSPRPSVRASRPTTYAAYRSECWVCFEDIEPGESITVDSDGSWVHTICAEEADS